MWIREQSLQHQQGQEKIEQFWIRRDGRKEDRYPVQVTIGKKTNMVALKAAVLNSMKDQVEMVRSTRESLYGAEDLEKVEACPVCKQPTKGATPKSEIYRGEYVQCNHCGHIFVHSRPTEAALNQFYEHNTHYASTYTDRAAAEKRLDHIYKPWVNWMSKVYREQYGVAPRSILDVGAGGGHFIAACGRENISGRGIELSDDSRAFAREIWGVDLVAEDFCGVNIEPADVVTFWGLLEHVPDPGAFIKAASRALHSGRGMVIAKVPRWDSLSAYVQRENPETIIRHLDPLGHITCFTDSSMAELLYLHGFKPVSAWYYGMDVYETMMQIGLALDMEDIMAKTQQLQMNLQGGVDAACFSDQLVIAAVPVDN